MADDYARALREGRHSRVCWRVCGVCGELTDKVMHVSGHVAYCEKCARRVGAI